MRVLQLCPKCQFTPHPFFQPNRTQRIQWSDKVTALLYHAVSASHRQMRCVPVRLKEGDSDTKTKGIQPERRPQNSSVGHVQARLSLLKLQKLNKRNVAVSIDNCHGFFTSQFCRGFYTSPFLLSVSSNNSLIVIFRFFQVLKIHVYQYVVYVAFPRLIFCHSC